jgi:hypothetical protein
MPSLRTWRSRPAIRPAPGANLERILVAHEIVETRPTAPVVLGTNTYDHRTPIAGGHPFARDFPQPIVEVLFLLALEPWIFGPANGPNRPAPAPPLRITVDLNEQRQ